jgi:hypothetical protein
VPVVFDPVMVATSGATWRRRHRRRIRQADGCGNHHHTNLPELRADGQDDEVAAPWILSRAITAPC